MLVADAVSITVIRRGRRAIDTVMTFVLLAVLMVVLAVVIGRDPFDAARLVTHGIFGHAVIVLLGTACIKWSVARGQAVCGVVLTLSLSVVAVDAFLVEPTWLEVSRVRLTSSKLSQPLRIVLVADLQTDVIGDYEKEVLQKVVDQKPDLILMAGDYLHVHDDERRAELRGLLRNHLVRIGFGSPLGVYAVQGNTDSSDWPAIFKNLPVKAFKTTETVDVGPLRLTCLSESDSFDPRQRVEPVDRFHVVLGHAPDFALGPVQADLLVAGHTHGGQVRLPWFGPPVTLSRVPRAWAAGVTKLDPHRTLIVSRGIGMERSRAPRLRFLCRPQLVVIDVGPVGEVASRK